MGALALLVLLSLFEGLQDQFLGEHSSCDHAVKSDVFEDSLLDKVQLVLLGDLSF